jgi:YD repeat-containing protein
MDLFDSAAKVIRRTINWAPPVGTQITDPNGVTTSLSSTLINGVPRLTSQSQPAGSGCEASSNSLGYDANGNVVNRLDFAGRRSCMAYDLTRNLETARVEGLTAADTCPADIAAYAVPTTLAADKPQRKVTTQWHPLWRLEARRAEPNKITTTVYNGQPDPLNVNAVANCAPSAPALPDGSPIAVVCKRYEQATTDATGSLGFAAALQAGVPVKSETYTYNQFGQVLTAKGPRTDVNDTTSYTYYADTKYNPHGQVLQSTDANGVVTVNTYDLRQRLTSTKVATELTQYGYDPVGQLIKLTLPSGAVMGYTYDAAHRLTDITDAAGNKVHYTLDAMGNRTNETVSDTGGVLARNITRAYDALNRLQSQQQAAVR